MKLAGLAMLALASVVLGGCHRHAADTDASSAANVATPAMRAYIDPATGRLGPPPTAPSSQGAPRAQAQVQSAASVPAPVFHTRADGTVEMNLNRKQQIRGTLDSDGNLHQRESAVTGVGPRR